MKFINKTTKVILNPKSQFVIDQFKKNPDLMEYKEVEKTEVVKEVVKEQPIKTEKKRNKD